MDTVLRPANEPTGEFDESPFHKVIWINCPKCGDAFWYSAFIDSPKDEIEETTAEFRNLLDTNCLGAGKSHFG